MRYETNDYSVPTEYGHRQVLLKAFVWKVVISSSGEVIAQHARSYGRDEMIFNPLHYFALLERWIKPRRSKTCSCRRVH